MGQPARRHATEAPARRPHLAVVTGDRSAPTTRRSPAACRAHEARCRETFTAFVVLAVLFAGLGVARVALAARAAAVSIESGKLRKEIKDARFEGDSLEIQVSALAAPSRIQAIAGSTMHMSKAGEVCYIAIDGTRKCSPAPAAVMRSTARSSEESVSSDARAARSVPGGLVASIMQTAAGEAQALLIGDVGLASSR